MFCVANHTDDNDAIAETKTKDRLRLHVEKAIEENVLPAPVLEVFDKSTGNAICHNNACLYHKAKNINIYIVNGIL